MPVPYTFGNATTSIPLSQLDSNFATAITIGNTAVQLGNTITTMNNLTLANVTISSGNATVTTLTAPTHNSASSLTFQTNGTTTAMTIDASQNVGIGTTSPSAKLMIAAGDSATATNQMIVSGGRSLGSVYGSAGSLLFTNSYWTGGYGAASISGIDSGGSGGYLAFATTTNGGGTTGTPTERMRIDSSGNVGIGTSSPGNRLHISGSSNSQSGVSIQSTGASGRKYTIYSSSAGGLYFANDTGGGDQMVLDASGNLLVGATSAVASSRLLIKGSGTTSGSTNIYIQDSAATALFYIRDDGALNTGTSSLSPYNLTTATAANAQLGADGFMRRSTSSLKYKTDVKDATHGLAEVMQLRPVTYKGKTDGDKVFGGLIAEEVDAVGLTEFVQYAEDGSPDALAYGNMVSLLVKAIQQLKAELDALKGTK